MAYRANKSRSKWLIIIMATVLVVLMLAIAGALVVRRAYYANLEPVSSSQESKLFTVPMGASVKEIAADLHKTGLIRSAWSFEWFIRNQDLRDELQAGTYSLRPNMSVPDIANVLTQGKVATDLVTILPGQRLDQIRVAFTDTYKFDPTEVSSALDPANYANHPALVDKPQGASLEGYLYPESFQKTAQTNPQTVVKASLDEMQKQLTPELRAGIVRQGLTVHQGVILGSIIEREVGSPDDKRVVAQIFLRRLREDHNLESDATAFYGAALAGAAPSLNYESSYNTYTHAGLPPGPISNVSASSLAAVANPAATDYLYFVSGDDGKTYFSHTLEEHEAQTSAHCQRLCQQ